jgi:hypothetical protein
MLRSLSQFANPVMLALHFCVTNQRSSEFWGVSSIDSTVGSRIFFLTAQFQAQHLYFWNALPTYRGIRQRPTAAPCYIERCELHMVLDEWYHALVLAKKSLNLVYFSVLSFAFAECLPAVQNLESLLGQINRGALGIINSYKLLLVLLLSVFCEMSLSETAKVAVWGLQSTLERWNLENEANALRSFLACALPPLSPLLMSWLQSLSSQFLSAIF